MPADEPMARRMYDFGYAELCLDSRMFWIWRIPSAGPALRQWSAIGYRTQQDAYDAAARCIRGANKGG